MAASARMMRVVGWGTLIAPVVAFVYPPGFLWGTHPESPHHPPLSPYLFMLGAMYAAWAILMIRGARDPLAHRSIVDYGILANGLQGWSCSCSRSSFPMSTSTSSRMCPCSSPSAPSCGSGTRSERSAEHRHGKMDHDAIVVGTGYGGATAAAVLARAGLRVGILERGTWWGAFGGHRPLPETVPQVVRAVEGLNLSVLGRSLRIPLSRRGLLEAHVHGTTMMMNAVAVGGTSLVNSALMQRPAGAFFDALPAELTACRARAALPGRRRGPLDRAGSGRRRGTARSSRRSRTTGSGSSHGLRRRSAGRATTRRGRRASAATAAWSAATSAPSRASI